jgi:hypothetical protein
MNKTCLFSSVLFIGLLESALAQDTTTVSTADELQAIFSKPVYNIEVHLLPGEYHLTPSLSTDSSCGNCQDPDTVVSITQGLMLSGSAVKIIGPPDQSATIITHSGYGIFVNHCEYCSIENLAITGGERDPDGNATDAAIVVKDSKGATIRNNRIYDNIGDAEIVTKTVVGIMGICGRENSDIYIQGNHIIRNSWDGITLYRDARAVISRNVIDGVDKAAGSDIGGGRGVAIGLTWNAQATIENNLVTRYWKGIGIFVDAHASVNQNIVEDMLTWGISLWDAGKGNPVADIEYNVIYKTGACGASITSSTPDTPGHFTHNVLVHTAQNPRYDSPDDYCHQCALAKEAIPDNFEISDNIFYDNRRATPDLPNEDIPELDFQKAIGPICFELSLEPIFQQSRFVKEFCRNK